MNDVDLTAELLTLIKYGITDKKTYVDKLFESDITDGEYTSLGDEFKRIVDILNELNKIFPIRNTRYKQRNDLYTLFNFLKENPNLGIIHIKNIYKSMVILDKDIIPSNDDCYALQYYAFNCISQSNSKDARAKRLTLYNNLFLNKSDLPNEDQTELQHFYGIQKVKLKKIDEYYLLNTTSLNSKIKESIVFK